MREDICICDSLCIFVNKMLILFLLTGLKCYRSLQQRTSQMFQMITEMVKVLSLTFNLPEAEGKLVISQKLVTMIRNYSSTVAYLNWSGSFHEKNISALVKMMVGYIQNCISF